MGLLTGQNTPRFSQYTADQFVGTGSQTIFTLSRTPPTASSLIVTIEGVKQHSNTYSITSNQIIFSEAPPSGSSIECIAIGTQGPSVVPSDNSVTNSKLTDNAVTAGKLSAGSVTQSKLDIGVAADGTGAMHLPAGSTAQRPSNPAVGYTRFNTTLSAVEYYATSGWIGIGVLDGSSSAAAAPSAAYIKSITGTTVSGYYWIKNSAMSYPVQVYCDMSYDSGGYMLLAYGYVASTSDSASNYAIPNLNHDGSAWAYSAESRASTNGLVASPNSQKSALLLAKNSTNVIMAAGNNPSSGGIDNYAYVYKIQIPNPTALTFNNHSYYYNSSMTNSGAITVTGLKGETGTWTRYTIVEALGASWGDSYPSGYGFIESTSPKNASWNNGPFFPSIHSGSRSPAANNAVVVSSSPDIGVNGYGAGARSYTYRGWYTAGGTGYTGQTSIWVK